MFASMTPIDNSISCNAERFILINHTQIKFFPIYPVIVRQSRGCALGRSATLLGQWKHCFQRSSGQLVTLSYKCRVSRGDS